MQAACKRWARLKCSPEILGLQIEVSSLKTPNLSLFTFSHTMLGVADFLHLFSSFLQKIVEPEDLLQGTISEGLWKSTNLGVGGRQNNQAIEVGGFILLKQELTGTNFSNQSADKNGGVIFKILKCLLLQASQNEVSDC